MPASPYWKTAYKQEGVVFLCQNTHRKVCFTGSGLRGAPGRGLISHMGTAVVDTRDWGASGRSNVGPEPKPQKWSQAVQELLSTPSFVTQWTLTEHSPCARAWTGCECPAVGHTGLGTGLGKLTASQTVPWAPCCSLSPGAPAGSGVSSWAHYWAFAMPSSLAPGSLPWPLKHSLQVNLVFQNLFFFFFSITVYRRYYFVSVSGGLSKALAFSGWGNVDRSLKQAPNEQFLLLTLQESLPGVLAEETVFLRRLNPVRTDFVTHARSSNPEQVNAGDICSGWRYSDKCKRVTMPPASSLPLQIAFPAAYLPWLQEIEAPI